MSVQTIVTCNGRRYFQQCQTFLPLSEPHSEPAARYEAHRAGWTSFGENDYCPSCSREQAEFSAMTTTIA